MDGEVTLRVLPVASFLTGVAYCLLAFGLFTLAKQFRSRAIALAGVAFSFCAFGLLLRVILFFTLYQTPHHAFEDITSSYGFYLLVNGLRPYVTLAAALCLVSAVRSSGFAKSGT